MWLNEHDINELQDDLDPADTPNLAHGAWVLCNLMHWTNRNSDGWPYWQKPSRAASRLMDLLYERDYAIRFGHDRQGKPLEDITKAELTKALAPIKSMLTKFAADHDVSDPHAEVLGA